MSDILDLHFIAGVVDRVQVINIDITLCAGGVLRSVAFLTRLLI